MKPLKIIFKVFNTDIKNLLSMSDMWKNRAPPTPLDYDKIADGSFAIPKTSTIENGSSDVKVTNGSSNSNTVPGKSSGLKDQKELTVQENLVLFVSRYSYLPHKLLDLYLIFFVVLIAYQSDYNMEKKPYPLIRMTMILLIL